MSIYRFFLEWKLLPFLTTINATKIASFNEIFLNHYLNDQEHTFYIDMQKNVVN